MESTVELRADLAALVRGLGRRLVDVIPLSHRGAPPVATAFRLRFADGTVLKGSTVPSREHIDNVLELAPDLWPFVPRLVAHGGLALLSEWVEGDDLTGVDWSAALLRRCGAAQARVHLRPARARDPVREVQGWWERISDGFDDLTGWGLLSGEERTRLEALARRFTPASVATAVSLGDYCPENIVCRADGEPCLIDVETLKLAPADFDLGRTWYRWPMTAAQRAAFLDGYGALRDPSAFLAHRPFWLVAALVPGACFRHRQHRPDVGVPLDGLRALLRAGAADT